MKKKRVLILGAGIHQLPLIQRAVCLKYHVITLDYLPDNIGHKFSHESINCSTIEKDAVLAHAINKHIDAICTCASDIATETVAFVAETMELRGPSIDAARVMSNKARFRAFQRDNGLLYPEFTAGHNLERLVKYSANNIEVPFVIKPVDTSGSRGIVKIDNWDTARVLGAVQTALGYSRSGWVCLEKFIDGVEIGGDCFLTGGRIEFILMTHKRKKGMLVTGHSLPTNISFRAQGIVSQQLELCCSKLDYMDGPLNFDVIVKQDQAYVLEMSPRLGGNGIPLLIERATGTDLFKALIFYAVGKPRIHLGRPAVRKPCGSWVFGIQKEGILRRIVPKEYIFAKVPEVFAAYYNYAPGELVPAFDHGGHSLGIFLFDCLDLAYGQVVDKLKKEALYELS